MKKFILTTSAAVALGLMSVASANPLGACGACHQAAADTVGPSFNRIREAYGSAEELTKVFESGFAVDDRKVAATNDSWKAKAGLMTGQYNALIKGKGKEVAEALFAQ